ncbi:MerR family transcriptional regulator, partial [Acinetobacter baumannii]
RKAYRVQRDFDASLAAVAVMLDLIDEAQQVRKQLKHFH